MRHKRTVALYIPALNLGGAQRVTVDIANGLADRGYDVHLVLSHRRGELLADVDDAVRIVELSTPQVPGLGVLASLPSFVEYLRSERPDVLLSQMTYANVVAILASKVARTGVTVVATEHDSFAAEARTKDRFVSFGAKAIYRLADSVVGVSRGVAESVAEETFVDESDVAVLHNPIPIEKVYERSTEPVDSEYLESDEYETILTVGRLSDQKDHATLIRAFARLHERRPNTRLVIVGTGERESELRSLVDRLDLKYAVSFAGFVDNVYAYMGSASVFALSSRHEGLPTVLIEALACGCPVVSTDCPSGPREILQNGTYGPLVPVGDDRSLAEAIIQALDSPVSSELLRERASGFSTESALEEYVGFIGSVSGEDQPSGERTRE